MSKRKIKQLSLKKTIFLSISSIVTILVIFLVTLNVVVSNRRTTTYASLGANEISNQIILNYENYFKSMFTTISYLEVEILNERNSINLEEKFKITTESRNDINNLSLFDLNGDELVTTGNNHVVSNDYLNQIISKPTIYNYSIPYTVNGIYYIQIGKLVNYDITSAIKEAILIVECNFQNIIDVSNSASLGVGGSLFISDYNYEIVYSSSDSINNSDDCVELNEVKKLIVGSSKININNRSYVINVQTLSNTRWKIAIVINVDEFFAVQVLYNILLIVLGVVGVLLAIILSSFVSSRIANPIKELEHSMKLVEDGDLTVKSIIDINKSQVEIVKLSDNFNKMIDRIKKLMDDVVEEQKSKRVSELKALQNQINPHFLYNTLDSIVFLAESNKNDEVETMVIALAKFFRISISKGKAIITVSQELEHVKNYMIIQSIRYKDAFTFTINVDPDCCELEAMKLMLQPFVENSIYHGLKNLDDEGVIKIDVFKDDTFLYYTITDNGLGMRKEKINEVYENMKNNDVNNSVGIKNVYQRLKIYYGDKADILIESELDEYTKVTIKVPLIREGK